MGRRGRLILFSAPIICLNHDQIAKEYPDAEVINMDIKDYSGSLE
jgi:hypothetical protein